MKLQTKSNPKFLILSCNHIPSSSSSLFNCLINNIVGAHCVRPRAVTDRPYIFFRKSFIKFRFIALALTASKALLCKGRHR